MIQVALAVLACLRTFLRSRHDLVLEILALRQQLAVLKRRHRAGFRLYWRFRSRVPCLGRRRIEAGVFDLVKPMTRENFSRGAPKIHGELLKLGIEISEPTVSPYLLLRTPSPADAVQRRLTLTQSSANTAPARRCRLPGQTRCWLFYAVAAGGRLVKGVSSWGMPARSSSPAMVIVIRWQCITERVFGLCSTWGQELAPKRATNALRRKGRKVQTDMWSGGGWGGWDRPL